MFDLLTAQITSTRLVLWAMYSHHWMEWHGHFWKWTKNYIFTYKILLYQPLKDFLLIKNIFVSTTIHTWGCLCLLLQETRWSYLYGRCQSVYYHRMLPPTQSPEIQYKRVILHVPSTFSEFYGQQKYDRVNFICWCSIR